MKVIVTIFFSSIITFTSMGAAKAADISEYDYLKNVGNCACPYNVDSNGNLCNKRSAWCRKGGYAPLCDVTKISNDIMEDCKS